MKKIICGLVLCLGSLIAQPVGPITVTSLNFQGNPTPGISLASATIVGNQGSATYYYWLYAIDRFGYSINPTAPLMVTHAPNTLSVNNYIRIDWTASISTDNYLGVYVVRTSTPTPPGTECTACQLGPYEVDFPTTTINDDGTPLNDFAPIGFAGTPNMQCNFTITNELVCTSNLNRAVGFSSVLTPGIVYATYTGQSAILRTGDAAELDLTDSAVGNLILTPGDLTIFNPDYSEYLPTTFHIASLEIKDINDAVLLSIPATGIIKPSGGYSSVDGTAGITGATCSAWKNGLCVAP